MKVTPKSEDEVSQFKLWEKGTYSFEILEKVKFGAKEIRTGEAVSAKGNEMLVLVVQVFNDDGGQQVLIDYLTDAMDYKIRHASVACGQLDDYNAGTLDPVKFIGKCGKVKLSVSKGKAKPDGDGNYPDKNSISDYVVEEDAPPAVNGAAKHLEATGQLLDDTVPF